MRIVLMIFLVLIAGTACAGIEGEPEKKEAKKRYLYQWTDNKGTIHIADGFGKIPEKYRSKTQKIEAPKRQDTGVEDHGAQNQLQEHELMSEPGQEKAAWQRRIASWQNRLTDAENRWQDLEKERNRLLQVRGASALAPIENRLKAEQIERQMKEVQEEIASARHMLDTVLPEEARRAGVPPGWLRE